MESVTSRSFSPADYGPVLGPLIDVDRCRELDVGVPNDADRVALADMTVGSAFAHADVSNDDAARCCLSGVWLLHDFLDESHTISQGVDAPLGSFWHGIMHRREGDFSNAKYWFRRVGQHVVFEAVGMAAAELGFADWNPLMFVDACQAAVSSGDDQLCRRVQQAEWELLFDHCYRAAI